MGITAGVTFYMRKVEGGFQTLCPELEANAISLHFCNFQSISISKGKLSFKLNPKSINAMANTCIAGK